MKIPFSLTLAASLVLTGAASADELSVAMLILGKIDDNGFMEAGYDRLLKIRQELGAKVAYLDKVEPKKDALEEALRSLARQSPDMVIAHGGQNNEAAQAIAAEFPDIPFVVVQGNITGPNLSSYEVLQEDSAWLAGAAAGLLTKTGVVGHISGIRVTPGLKGRDGFYSGSMHSKPDAEFLTIFAGNQDDVDLASKVAKAEIEKKADIIFTMLTAGREGAIEAMRGTDAKQIGNVIDWTKIEPDVLIASAIADVSIPSVTAARDLAKGEWKRGVIKHIGLENPEAVSLVLSKEVPAEIRTQIDELREQIVNGEIKVSSEYDGPELKM